MAKHKPKPKHSDSVYLRENPLLFPIDYRVARPAGRRPVSARNDTKRPSVFYGFIAQSGSTPGSIAKRVVPRA